MKPGASAELVAHLDPEDATRVEREEDKREALLASEDRSPDSNSRRSSGWSWRSFLWGALGALLCVGVLALSATMVLSSLGLSVTIATEEVEIPEVPDLPDLDLTELGSDYRMPTEPLVCGLTKVPHPAMLVGPGPGAKVLVGLGAGARIKAIGPIKMKIYSVALYVEPKAAREGLGEYKGKTPLEMTADKTFFEELRDGTFDKAMRLSMTYEVGKAKMLSGLSDGLNPKLRQYIPDRAQRVAADFAAMFAEDSFKVKDTLLFAAKGSFLSFTVNGDTKGRGIDDAGLVRAFFAIYCDGDTPAPDARKRFGDRVSWLFGKD